MLGAVQAAMLGGRRFDPYWSYVKLLFKGDGAESAAVVDEKGHTMQTEGTSPPLVSTFNKKFGTGSVILPGTPSTLYTADSDDWYTGANDYVWDFWFRTTYSTQSLIVGQSDNVGTHTVSAHGIYHNIGSDGKIAWTPDYHNYPSNLDMRTSVTVNDGNFHHIACVRNGSDFYIYVDGTKRATATKANVTNVNSANPLRFGSMGATQYYNKGVASNIDMMRFTKGTNRNWTGSTITVPTLEDYNAP